jgi:hypothetical protein
MHIQVGDLQFRREKLDQEKLKKDEEEREAKRQGRKLEFLLAQVCNC